MIKVTVLYPNAEGANFDMGYYMDVHMPLVARLLGEALKGLAIDQGIGGMAPGLPAPFVAIGHLFFDSVAAFNDAFGPHTEEIVSDIPKYTNIQPLIQISEVRA